MENLDYWTKRVLTVSGGDSIRTAAALMEENNISALVITEDGRPEGIITQRDLTRAMAERSDEDKTKVAQMMTKNPVTLQLKSDPKTAERTMLGEGFRHMPVVDENGKLVGIISLRDILRTKKQ